MSALLPAQILEPNIDGVQVETADWLVLPTYLEATAGYAAMAAQGFANGLPQSGAPWPPLTCTPGSGLHVVVGAAATGSAPEWAFIDGIFAAALASQTFAVPSNPSGPTRQDIVCVQQIETQGSTVNRPIEGGGSANVPYNYSGMQFQYVENSLTPPTGYQVFAIISVPNGASSITTGDIAVQFETLNPAGAAGPQGPGTTTLTANFTIPAVGGNVTMNVVSNVGFPIGAQGIAVDNGGSTAMYFVVIGGTGDALLVMNMGDFGLGALGYSTSGAVHAPGSVCFANAAPFTFTTAAVNSPAFGANKTLSVNAIDQFAANSWGLLFNGTQAFIFQVQSTSTGTINVTCALSVMGSGSIPAGAYIIPICPPSIYYKDGSPLTGGVIEHSGSATISSGGSVAVAFAVPFADTSYHITLGAQGNYTCWASAKTTSGFTMNVGSGGGTGQVDWRAHGVLNL